MQELRDRRKESKSENKENYGTPERETSHLPLGRLAVVAEEQPVYGADAFEAYMAKQDEKKNITDIKQESDKRIAMQEKREHDSNMPRFRVKFLYCSGGHSNMKVKIENISDNVANDILVYRICIVKNKDKIWKCSTATRYNVIKANDELEVELKTEEIREDKYTIQFDFKCNDKYGEEHKYHAYAFCENNSSTPYFSLEEIS